MLKIQLALLGFTFLFTSIPNPTFSQTKFTMLNGGSFEGQILAMQDHSIMFSTVTDKGKVKQSEMSRYQVFSVTSANGAEEILYDPDVEGGDFSIGDMRKFMAGERAAQQRKNLAPFLTGAVIGAASYYSMGENLFLTTIPLFTTVSASMTGVIFKKHKHDPQSPFASEAYTMGYKRVAKSKKVLAVLKGTIAGLATGFITNRVAGALRPAPPANNLPK